MALLTPFKAALAGVVPVMAAATATTGDTFSNVGGGKRVLRVTNGSGGSINVTIAAGANPNRPADGAFPAMAVTDQVIAVGAGVTKDIGPFPSAFNDGNGLVKATCSAVSSVTVGVMQIDD